MFVSLYASHVRFLQLRLIIQSETVVAGTEMADHKVDDGLKKEIEAGKTLKDTPVPETGVNTHDATLAGNNLLLTFVLNIVSFDNFLYKIKLRLLFVP